MLRGIAAYLRRHHIALFALFFALGGSAVAASTMLPRNSVGTAQIKAGAVTKGKIAKKTLKQLKGNRGLKGARGAAGPLGPQGPQGPQGVQGAVGPSAAYQNYLNGNLAVSTTPATPTTINTLVLPGPGTYLVTASASLFDGATAPSTCTISATIARNGTTVGDHAELGTAHPTAAEYVETNLSTQRLLAVSGASQTITVLAYRNHGAGTCTVFNRELSATLVGSGVGTLSTAAKSAAAVSGPAR
jgi:hypothetical protein